MSGVMRYEPGELLRADARRTGRAISRMQAGSSVRLSRVEVEVEETIAKEDGYTDAAGNASGDVIRLAHLHSQLELTAPGASGRLALIADAHAFAMVDMLSDLRRELRRR